MAIEIVVFPSKHGDFPVRHVNLPEGNVDTSRIWRMWIMWETYMDHVDDNVDTYWLMFRSVIILPFICWGLCHNPIEASP